MHVKYRHLGRDSEHRRALLRNMVTSLIERESITTTWQKAKEAQKWAERLITLGKKNTNASRTKADGMVFQPEKHLPKVFGALRERYATRPGGYTRVLRSEAWKDDAAESAILELVDGPKDMRFAMTAKTLARMREDGKPMSELTALNVRKVTRFREDGDQALEAEVERLEGVKEETEREEKRQFDEEGRQWEWSRTNRYTGRTGPGKLRKKVVDSGEPGTDPHDWKVNHWT